MELTNEFEVAVPLEEAWAVLTDIELIAPCLPGAQLQEVVVHDGADTLFNGQVKVKVGPITAQYKGKAQFVSRDPEGGVAVLTASGRDTHGQGNASATITATLTEAQPGVTHVSLLTDLALTGKVAQFGRGVLGDVSRKLLDQFVENLESTVLQARDPEPAADAPAAGQPVAEEPAAEEPAAEEEAAVEPAAVEPAAEEPAAEPRPRTEVRTVASAEPEAVDLLASAGAPVLKRALPLFGIAAAVLLLLGIRRRRRRG